MTKDYFTKMNTAEIVSQINQEIARLTAAKELLQGTTAKKGPGRPRAVAATSDTKRTKKRRKLSAEGRARIAAAMKARWAKVKAKKA